MPPVLHERLRSRDTDLGSARCVMPIHRVEVLVHAVMRLQPRPLARMTGKHPQLGGVDRGDVDVRRRRHALAGGIEPLDRIATVEMRHLRPKGRNRRRRDVRRGEQKARRPGDEMRLLMVEHVVLARMRQHQRRTDPAKESVRLRQRRPVMKDVTVPFVETVIRRPDLRRRRPRLVHAGAGDRPAILLGRSAIARRHRRDVDVVACFAETDQRAAAEDLRVVRMRQ